MKELVIGLGDLKYLVVIQSDGLVGGCHNIGRPLKQNQVGRATGIAKRPHAREKQTD